MRYLWGTVYWSSVAWNKLFGGMTLKGAILAILFVLYGSISI